MGSSLEQTLLQEGSGSNTRIFLEPFKKTRIEIGTRKNFFFMSHKGTKLISHAKTFFLWFNKNRTKPREMLFHSVGKKTTFVSTSGIYQARNYFNLLSSYRRNFKVFLCWKWSSESSKFPPRKHIFQKIICEIYGILDACFD